MIFCSVCGLTFLSPTLYLVFSSRFFTEHKFEIPMKSNLFTFSFMVSCQRTLNCPQRFSFVLSSKNFIVVYFAFKPMSHLDLIFYMRQEIGQPFSFCFLVSGYQIALAHFFAMLSSLHQNSCALLLKIREPYLHDMTSCFSLYSVDLCVYPSANTIPS